ncbi:MAG: hypothetical protein ABIN36_04380 [Ferruginibacter sp.]
MCTPFATSGFPGYHRYYGYTCLPAGRSVPVKICEGVLIVRVLGLKILPLCRLYALAHLRTIFTYLCILNQYRFSKPAPQNCGVPPLRLSVSPGGFIPEAVNTSGNLPAGKQASNEC